MRLRVDESLARREGGGCAQNVAIESAPFFHGRLAFLLPLVEAGIWFDQERVGIRIYYFLDINADVHFSCFLLVLFALQDETSRQQMRFLPLMSPVN